MRQYLKFSCHFYKLYDSGLTRSQNPFKIVDAINDIIETEINSGKNVNKEPMKVMMSHKEKMNMLLAQKVNNNELNKSFHVNSQRNYQHHHLIRVNMQDIVILVQAQHNRDLLET